MKTIADNWTGLFNAVLGLPGTAHSELVRSRR